MENEGKLPDGSEVCFRLVRKKNMRRIIIHMDKGKDYWISMPLNASVGAARDAAEAHLDWIIKQRDFLEQNEDNESLAYLGKRYPLSYVEAPSGRVEFNGSSFVIYGPTREYANEYLGLWWKQKAQEVLVTLTADWYARLLFPSRGIRFPQISVRKMKTRWGSCTWTNGTIRYNSNLLHKDKELIAYVVLHELAHLIYPNHAESFHAFLSEKMPDWKERRARLNSVE